MVSPVRTRTPTSYLDFLLSPGATHRQDIPAAWTAFAYTLEGEVEFGEWYSTGKSIFSKNIFLSYVYGKRT